MTMPHERTRALRFAGEFLRELLNTDIDPELKRQARLILRHYPSPEEIGTQAQLEIDKALQKEDDLVMSPPWIAPEN